MPVQHLNMYFLCFACTWNVCVCHLLPLNIDIKLIKTLISISISISIDIDVPRQLDSNQFWMTAHIVFSLIQLNKFPPDQILFRHAKISSKYNFPANQNSRKWERPFCLKQDKKSFHSSKRYLSKVSRSCHPSLKFCIDSL